MFAPPGIQLRFRGRPARILFTIPTMVSWFQIGTRLTSIVSVLGLNRDSAKGKRNWAHSNLHIRSLYKQQKMLS
jgi:hypothetical protein